jgi:hypothetical protein
VGTISLRGQRAAKRGLRAVIGGMLASAAVAGCASGPSDALAGQSGRQVLDKAVGNLTASPSFTLSGKVTEAGTTYTVHLGYRPGRGCTGTVAQAGRGGFTMTVIGTTAWVRPDEAFWKPTAGGRAPSVISAVKGKYLRGSTTDRTVAGLTSLCDLTALTAQLQAPATVTRAAVTPLDGALVVPLRNASQGGTLYVTDNARPQVVELANSKAGKITFHVGAPVTLTPPPANQTVNGATYGF